jgi:hypothetical protein
LQQAAQAGGAAAPQRHVDNSYAFGEYTMNQLKYPSIAVTSRCACVCNTGNVVTLSALDRLVVSNTNNTNDKTTIAGKHIAADMIRAHWVDTDCRAVPR